MVGTRSRSAVRRSVSRERSGRGGAPCVPVVLAALLVGVAGASGQTTVLRGELLLRDGQPATDVRLVIVGHPPEVVLRDGALFSHTLAGAPSEVTVRVVGQPETEVLFPPAGRVVIPADPAAVVSVLVGERIGVVVEDRIERDLRSLRETLEVRGVSEAEIEAVLRTELDGLVSRIAAITEGAVESAVAGAAQVELRERVNRYLGSYVRRTRDLVDAFGLVDPGRGLNLQEFGILRDAIGNYSDAFVELDRELGEVPAALERAWAGERGLELRDRLTAVLELIRSDVHSEMLDLRAPLVTIQLDFTPDRPASAAVRSAREAVVEALPRLTIALERLEELEAQVPPLMEALRGPSLP